MRLKIIHFKESEDGKRQLPDELTVTMSAAEAVLIAKIVSKMSDAQAHEEHGAPFGTLGGIYDVLVGDVFNHYYENGITDL